MSILIRSLVPGLVCLIWATTLVPAQRSAPLRESAVAACSPKGSRSALEATLEVLPGTYALTVVRTAGPRIRDTVTARLELWRPPNAKTNDRWQPLQGVTDLDAARMGATVDGDPQSRDPAHPGVSVTRVIVGRDGNYINTIELIVGSVATGRSGLSMDSLPPMLRVLQTDSAAFYGTWTGTNGRVESSGHFCALRTRGI
jgi:hypothetical protein